ncbi:symmetrical bis(5'-nucleosyl)-tetraphosphatase [Thiomicrorhabdus sp.]|uniref:symmetrical bis(5'-nucleosyl)-tetraphosphatase n=1 Tax=Thiomicrorhabdus sp. TaxID=2039724 RepID=UPI0029C71554|nr:symmetrical bis(5'-nucleosyl)-tetraphosphatase [Thiomicrorhabdus sp.]
MATYIIGDLHGCYDELQKLLKKLDYDREKDHLWFVGDIINRGPKSLESLRFVKQLCEAGKADMVLGNHDFHLLAAFSGLDKYLSKSDRIDDILNSPDVAELVDWLRHQPLMVKHPFYQTVMVHAGIPPQWSIREALDYAKEVEVHLQSGDWQTFLKEHLFGSQPDEWIDGLQGWDRIRYIVNSFARMRYCDRNGKLEFKQKGAPQDAQSEWQPWFVFPNRRNKDYEIFFGHWSTLGAVDAYQVHATDTGCLWGGCLTAYHLEEKKRITVDCPQQQKPKLKNKVKQKS